jgi:hypothetical protein
LVDNIEVMRKCGIIDFVLNQKVVSNFLQQCCGAMGLNVVKCFAGRSRNFQDTDIYIFTHIEVASRNERADNE